MKNSQESIEIILIITRVKIFILFDEDVLREIYLTDLEGITYSDS